MLKLPGIVKPMKLYIHSYLKLIHSVEFVEKDLFHSCLKSWRFWYKTHSTFNEKTVIEDMQTYLHVGIVDT